MRFTTEALFAAEYDPYCHFGIISGPLIAGITGALVDAGIGTAAAGGAAGLLGAGATTALAGGLGGGLIGAGLGAGEAAITGGNPLTGALTGGITGGAIGGFGPEIGSATGLGTTAGDAIAGGVGGFAGAELTGGNPLLGAATGGVGGLVAGSAGAGAGGTPSTTVTASPTTGTGGGTGAGSIAPASIAAPGAGGGNDLASAVATGGGTAAGGSAVSDSFGLAPPSTGANLLGLSDPGMAPVSAPAGAAAPSSGSWLSNLFGGGGGGAAGGGLGKILGNPGVLLAGGALGADILMGNQPLPAQNQLTQAAGEAASMGRGLSSYIFSGTLPPGAQEAVTNATTAATAKIKSSFAALGMAGSTAESQAVQQIHEAAAAQTFQMADQLLKQGANYSQLSDQLYQTLLQTQMSQENALTQSIGTFAAGLAGASLKSGA